MEKLNNCYVCGGTVHHVTYSETDTDDFHYTLLLKCNKCMMETGAYRLYEKDYYTNRDKIQKMLTESWNAKCVWIHLKGGIYGCSSYWLPGYLEQQKRKEVKDAII